MTIRADAQEILERYRKALIDARSSMRLAGEAFALISDSGETTLIDPERITTPPTSEPSPPPTPRE